LFTKCLLHPVFVHKMSAASCLCPRSVCCPSLFTKCLLHPVQEYDVTDEPGLTAKQRREKQRALLKKRLGALLQGLAQCAAGGVPRRADEDGRERQADLN